VSNGIKPVVELPFVVVFPLVVHPSNKIDVPLFVVIRVVVPTVTVLGITEESKLELICISFPGSVAVAMRGFLTGTFGNGFVLRDEEKVAFV